MRAINLIVIHCSASPNGKSLFRGTLGKADFRTPVQVIDEWHRAPSTGFHRSAAARARFNHDLTSIGYHFVLYTNGGSATGRSLDEIGAHVAGHNAHSIGICLIGTDKFTQLQWKTLAGLVSELRKRYPNARVCGHRDLSPDIDGDGTIEPREWLKTCPCFSVADWLAQDMRELPDHIWPLGSSK